MIRPRLLPRLAAVLALAGLVTACSIPAGSDGSPSPSTAPSPFTTPSASADQTCADAVDVTIDVRDAATGSAFLVLQNTGEEDCSLSGFPTVIAVDPEGGSVGNPAEESDGVGAATTAVALAPGDRAYAALVYTPAGKVGAGECGPQVPVRGFSVVVPGATHEEFVDVPDLTFCTSEAWMSLSSVGPVDSEPRAASS